MKKSQVNTIRLIFIFLFVLQGKMHAQINFSAQHSKGDLHARALKADAAIENGDYGNVHSLLVVKDGELVFEKYYQGWKVDSAHQAQSVTKSVIATMLGVAIQRKFIASVDEPILKYYPKYKDISPSHKKIKLKDLLTQRHGLKWAESPWNSPNNNWRNLLNYSGDWYRKILETIIEKEPGTHFNYSNAAPTLISGAVQNASGMDIQDFAKKYLFDLLNISNYRFWQGNGGPQNNGMALVFMTSRDLAKIGQLYLQEGSWNGKQIIPKEFAVKAVSSIVNEAEGNPIYESYDYGYFWWSRPVSRAGVEYTIFLARGAGGQLIIVEPNSKMVVVITAWNLRAPNRVQTLFDRYLATDYKKIINEK